MKYESLSKIFYKRFTEHSEIYAKSFLNDSAQISFRTCEDIRAFYDEFAHNEVTSSDPTHRLDGGLFRRAPVDITSAFGKILHRGVHPEERIIALLNIALRILHNPNMPLLASSYLPYLFEYIHPFLQSRSSSFFQ